MLFRDLENLWIISDTHFYHTNIEKYEPKRLEIAKSNGYEDSFQYMIDKWNEKIKPDDEVLHLGDFAWWKNSISEITSKLNGKKTIIRGNHDRVTYRFPEAGWRLVECAIVNVAEESIYDSMDFYDNESFNNTKNTTEYNIEQIKMGCIVLDVRDVRLLFSHRPLIIKEEEAGTWTAKMIKMINDELFVRYNCDYNIHGHTHSVDLNIDNFINVSVEKTNLEPIRLGELIDKYNLTKTKSAFSH